MTIAQKVDRLVQAVANYERADIELQNLPASGYFRTEPDVETARVPYRDALGGMRDRASDAIREAPTAIYTHGIKEDAECKRTVLLLDLHKRLVAEAEDEFDREGEIFPATKGLLERVTDAL